MPELEPITREEKLLDGEDLTPITRKEKFIRRIYDNTQVIPEPITREEYFLKKAGEGGGGDIDLQTLNVTENGTVNAPSGVAYNKVITNVPLPSNAYLLKELSNLPQPIASFSDGADAVMQSLKVGIEPVQDLHGYDSPWAGGAGKNKCPVNSGTITVGDFVTFDTPLPSGTYSFSLKATRTPSSSAYASLQLYDANGTAYSDVIGIASNMLDGTTIKIENKTLNNGLSKIYVYSIAGNWSDSRNYTLTISDLQIEQGSTATTYEPYSNICPISGWNEVNVTVADDLENPTVSNVYTIDLDGTRYGGKLDVANGVLTVDRASIKLSDLIWTKQNTANNNWRFKSSPSIQNIKIPTSAAYKIDNLCSVYRNITANETWTADDTGIAVNADASLLICDLNQVDVTALNTVLANQTICYELATPTTFYTQPTSIKSLDGVNNVFASTGDVEELKYFSKEVE